MRNRHGNQGDLPRPYKPDFFLEKTADQIAEALDHVARAMSAIDHHVEVLAINAQRQTELLSEIANSPALQIREATAPNETSQPPRNIHPMSRRAVGE
jgi:hypothetical protein